MLDRSRWMGRLAAGMFAAGVLGLTAPGSGAAPLDDKGGKPPARVEESCVKVSTQAPYRGFGYDHIVELRNTCPKAMSCNVHTDVNPTQVEVSVPAGEAREVSTFRGSPASTFKPTVSCKPAG